MAGTRENRPFGAGHECHILAGLGGVLYLLISSLLAGGDISVGSFAAVFASLNLMFSLMEEILVRHFGMLSKTMGTVRNFIRYLDLEERKGKAIAAGAANIVVKNASFTYPGASSPSLKRINLEVRRGETLAIVGQNGAGKSTLVRLLTGIYLPDEGGEVLVHGVSTKELAPEGLFQGGVSAVFQKFQRYQMTLRDNVMIGDLNSQSTKDFEDAVAKADLDLAQGLFRRGENTMLSREFDGVDLSGGGSGSGWR